MVNQELAERLLPDFSVLHFFIRHHQAERPITCVKDCKAGNIKQGDRVLPEVKDFTILWTVDEISHMNGGRCRSDQAEAIMMWRRSKNEKPETTRKRFRNVSIGRLKSFGWVTTREDPIDKRYNFITLTQRGTQYLKKLRNERVRVLTEILSFMDEPVSNREELVKKFDQMAKNAWQAILVQAREFAPQNPIA